MKTTRTASVVHLELHTPDLPAACAFYAQLCGWREESVRTAAGSYSALTLAGSLGGGVVECPLARPLWLPYVQTDDVAAATERACVLGARVLLDPREGPSGWRAVVSAPHAGELALWQPKR
jgi:uncharacterized protein